MKEAFIVKNFREDSLIAIDWINEVLDKYRSLGYDLTVRQVYYQLVAQDLIPNNIRSYKRIQSLISDGRKAGMISWDMIVDRTRSTKFIQHWENPGQIVQAAVDTYKVDKWERQPNHVEVMCEKEALSGILAPACRDLDVNFTANKGYSSDSLMYRTALRLGRKYKEGKEVHVIYFGDHDPSGLDMDRDIADRLSLFSYYNVEVVRHALLMEQVDRWGLPENPAKTTDSRYYMYSLEHGESSWELDAVEPTELVNLVTGAVEHLRDEIVWDEDVEREEEGREQLQAFADEYEA